MEVTPPTHIGYQARLFPTNWRPLSSEIAFALVHGFAVLQLRAPESGLLPDHLGAAPDACAAELEAASVASVIEIVVKLGADGRTATGGTPLDTLRASLPISRALRCSHIHWHIVPSPGLAQDTCTMLEHALAPAFADALQVTQEIGAQFAVENGDDAALFSTPAACSGLLEAVPGLGLVWDLNHTAVEHVRGYQKLAPRITMLHVADTRLPSVNEHLPLGEGTLELSSYLDPVLRTGFRGPAVLEVGGLPKSGGFGRDTDAALISSRRRLLQVLQHHTA